MSLCLIDAGWGSKDVVIFHSSGDEPPTGITILVDGLNSEAVTSARYLITALNVASVEDVKLEIEQNLPDPLASSWVLIKVGRKANQ